MRAHRGARPHTGYQLVDTCAGEFPAQTPYFYSSYDDGHREHALGQEKVLILGSGPNRIGQGIEFDYSCVHGVQAAREMGYEALMLNCNPETVSTDFDVADKLYFEPVFWERVLDVIDLEEPEGVILQLGGQTALKLAARFDAADIHIFGTQPAQMDLAESRGKFSGLLKELGIPFPPYGMARTVDEAVAVADRVGYPTLIRPSYVLGGQGMRIAINRGEVAHYVERIWDLFPDNHILLDRFLEDAVEVDVDSVADGEDVWITGLMQHIEPAGVHSGDSTAVLPPYSLSDAVQATIRTYVTRIAKALDAVGLINVQLVVKGDDVYVIEANPRASRTVPFVAKATGIPISNIATKVMLGAKIGDVPRARRFSNRSGRVCDQGAGLFVGQVPRGAQRTRPGDEVHRRSDCVRGQPDGRALRAPVRDAQPVPLALSAGRSMALVCRRRRSGGTWRRGLGFMTTLGVLTHRALRCPST